jgi:HEPN domain-containing protein
VQPGRTHDLVALLRECSTHEQNLTRLLADCQFLTAFAVHARYPDDLGEPSEEDACAASASLERIYAAVSRCLPDHGDEADW